MVAVSSWGRLAHAEHTLVALDRQHLQEGLLRVPKPGLAHGLGRSYGDSCLNPGGVLWLTSGLDNFIDFDAQTGRLICEAGVALRDIQKFAIPQGWTLPVTPGTELVTVGGAIANDVHGKNHHRAGTFGDHIRNLTLARTDGGMLLCTPTENTDWFRATVGGLGLTGVILRAELQLQPSPGPWLETETIPYNDLADFFRLADESERDWEYTVSWIDCLSPGGSRGLFMRGNPVSAARPDPGQRRLTMPFTPPISLVNQFSLRCFNTLYFHLAKWGADRRLVHYRSFFYPLDGIQQWHRMYGPGGFFQYQSVVPRDSGEEAVRAMLHEIRRAGSGSFLAVLKTFGDRPAAGMLSFPRPGVTLALDFPNRGAQTHRLFERLDHIVSEARGRIYPAKDARMPRSLFESGYPGLTEFIQYRDPGISSGLSRRLLGS